MHDVMGRELKVGDMVLIPAFVDQLYGGADYCNVTAKSLFLRSPDDSAETFTCNTGVMFRANDLLDVFGFDDADEEGEDEGESEVAKPE